MQLVNSSCSDAACVDPFSLDCGKKITKRVSMISNSVLKLSKVYLEISHSVASSEIEKATEVLITLPVSNLVWQQPSVPQDQLLLYHRAVCEK